MGKSAIIAKADKKGLWQEDNPITLWKWCKVPVYK
jgi:hypothetical protein